LKGFLYDQESRRVGGEEDRDRFERREGEQYVFVGDGWVVGEEDGLEWRGDRDGEGVDDDG